MHQWLNFKAMASSGLPVRKIYIGRLSVNPIKTLYLEHMYRKKI